MTKGRSLTEKDIQTAIKIIKKPVPDYLKMRVTLRQLIKILWKFKGLPNGIRFKK